MYGMVESKSGIKHSNATNGESQDDDDPVNKLLMPRQSLTVDLQVEVTGPD